MPRLNRSARPFALIVAAGIAGPAFADGPPVADTVDFTRDVLPILSENCFACHGPDEAARKAELRLDTRDGLFGEGRSGELAVVPGKPGESELVGRITAGAGRRQMPPAKFGKTLKPAEVETLRRWVEDGAEYRTHWAFAPPTRPPVPKAGDWGANPIDQFIRARLATAGMVPNPEADKASLIRRVTLDLTGLPPTPAEVDAFLADATPTRIRDGRRPAPGLPAVRRAPGPVLARRRPVRRHPRPAPGQLPGNLAVPRLRHPGVQ